MNNLCTNQKDDANYHILKLSHELTFIRVIPDVAFNHMSPWSYNFSKVLNFRFMKFRKLLGDTLGPQKPRYKNVQYVYSFLVTSRIWFKWLYYISYIIMI